MKHRFAICSALTLCLGVSPAFGDIIQTKRGEIHNGLIDLKTIQLETAYGEIEVPRARMSRLVFGQGAKAKDRIITIDGEVFSGKNKAKSITTSRALGPDLPLETSELNFIEFEHNEAERQTLAQLKGTPDLFEMNNGDVFLGYHAPFTLSLEGKTIPSTNIDMVDLTYSDDEEALKIRIRQGEPQKWLRGFVDSAPLKLQTLDGQKLSLTLKDMQAVKLKYPYARGAKSPDKLRVSGFSQAYTQHILQDRFVDGSSAPLLHIIKAGEYMRGDMAGDFDEKPLQLVTLKQPFAIGVYEITFAEYSRFCRETACDMPEDSAWGRGRRPVINVSWEDAKAYTRWLSQKTGKTYRLPSDAEWEYAARAQTMTPYYWGSDLNDESANCAGCNTIWSAEKTAPVGRFAPNAYGLFDMSGNVFEWVEDCWNDQFEGIGLDGSAYQNPAGCGKRIIRGGGWSFPPKEIRSANRWRDFPTRRSDDTGFRVLRELSAEEITQFSQKITKN